MYATSFISNADYTIHITVDIDQFTVVGSTTVNLRIWQATKFLLIHVKHMNISEFTLAQNDKTVSVDRNFSYEENEFYVLVLSSQLSVGVASLLMKFDYPLGDGLVGFYRSSYNDSKGDTHWIGTTHFEPTDARKAFPCFDEPAMKANFTISITHSTLLNAHSNMPVRAYSEDGAVTTTHFETSVKMSTYLVAFVVSNFDCLTQRTDTVYGVNVSR